MTRYSARLAAIMSMALSAISHGRPPAERGNRIPVPRYRVSKHKGNGRAEAALPRGLRQRRAVQALRLRREKPGTVVLGREGRVQYPNAYGYAPYCGDYQWRCVGKLYGS